MANGFIIRGQTTNKVQIDGDYFNLTLAQSGSRPLVRDHSWAAQAIYSTRITYSGSTPMIALASSGPVTLMHVQNSGSSWTFYVTSPSASSVQYYIFDGRPLFDGPGEGAKVWNNSGQLVWHSNARLFNVVGVLSDTGGGLTGPLVGTGSLTLPAGRSYAVVQARLGSARTFDPSRVLPSEVGPFPDPNHYYWYNFTNRAVAVSGRTVTVSTQTYESYEMHGSNIGGAPDQWDSTSWQYVVVDVTGFPSNSETTPPLPQPSVSLSATSITASGTGGGTTTTGYVTASASGGSGSGYTYQWLRQDGDASVTNVDALTNYRMRTRSTGQPQGTARSAVYRVRVTDGAGQSVLSPNITFNHVQSAAAPLTVSLSTSEMVVAVPNPGGPPITTTTGYVNSTVTGGSGSYSYSWARVSGSAMINVMSPTNTYRARTQVNHPSNTFYQATIRVTVTDNNTGAVGSAQYVVKHYASGNISWPSPPPATINVTRTGAGASNSPVVSGQWTGGTGGEGVTNDFYAWTWTRVSGSTAVVPASGYPRWATAIRTAEMQTRVASQAAGTSLSATYRLTVTALNTGFTASQDTVFTHTATAPPISIDWPNFSWSVSSVNGMSGQPNFTVAASRTISGLTGSSNTMTLTGQVIGGGNAFVEIEIVRAGVQQGRGLRSQLNTTTVQGFGSALPIANGQVIAFRGVVSCSPASLLAPYVSMSKTVRVSVLINGAVVDTFDFTGTAEDVFSTDPGGPGGPIITP